MFPVEGVREHGGDACGSAVGAVVFALAACARAAAAAAPGRDGGRLQKSRVKFGYTHTLDSLLATWHTGSSLNSLQLVPSVVITCGGY